jgi:hypothetical protein
MLKNLNNTSISKKRWKKLKCLKVRKKFFKAVININLNIERYTEIERENRILLEKMTNILQKQRGTLLSANSAGVVGSYIGN